MSLPALSVEAAAELGARHGAPEHLRTSNISVRLLQSPATGSALLRFLNVFLTEGSLDKRTRELIILRVAWKTRSHYVFGRHKSTAQTCMSDTELWGVRDPQSCAVYGDADLAVLQATDELLDGAAIGEETQKVLDRHFSPRQVVDIILAVGNWRIFATLDNCAHVPLEPGYSSWPEGQA
jgi:alkylhydroperoxidase family enzyme